MTIPLEINFREMAPIPSVEASIKRWAGRLEHVYDRIQRCSVFVGLPGPHHRHGSQFHVRIDLAVPGREIAVSHDPERGHEDVYVAVADSFRAARRQLQDHARIKRGDVKMHA